MIAGRRLARCPRPYGGSSGNSMHLDTRPTLTVSTGFAPRGRMLDRPPSTISVMHEKLTLWA
jgi:hypothetical protein